MADKLTQQITDALSRAAADPAGLPLYASKNDAGLFPSTSAAKPAAQKCLADDLVRVSGNRMKSPRELYALTEKGWEFLLAQVNPKQVLEDFVRVLEARRGEVGELLDTARRMAESLQGLKDAVTRVLPSVCATRVPTMSRDALSAVSRDAESAEGSATFARVTHMVDHATALASEDCGSRLTVLALADTVLARLADWSGSAGEDCPLPELYRTLDSGVSIGEFHDCLRQLHDDGAIYLHPWTGPLYALPEPAYALLVGHGIAYYASRRFAVGSGQ